MYVCMYVFMYLFIQQLILSPSYKSYSTMSLTLKTELIPTSAYSISLFLSPHALSFANPDGGL